LSRRVFGRPAANAQAAGNAAAGFAGGEEARVRGPAAAGALAAVGGGWRRGMRFALGAGAWMRGARIPGILVPLR
jgi:hypothetical protein